MGLIKNHAHFSDAIFRSHPQPQQMPRETEVPHRQAWHCSKLLAILQMKTCHFMGMVNQFGKFSPSLATISQPLRELLSENTVWVSVKKELTSV